MRRYSFRVLAGSLLLASFGWSAPGGAQEVPPGYPVRPIRIIVSSVPGGGLDLICRSVGQMLAERLGQSVIVDNRTGGGTVVATEIAARAAPDGYTFFAGTDTLRVVGITKRVAFDVRTDVRSGRADGRAALYLIVNPTLPVKNVKDLIAYSMNQPLYYGSSGVGTVAHLGLEYLTAKSGARFVHVPYKGGAQSLLALLGGEIQMYPGLLLSAGAAVKTGKARPLAALSLHAYPGTPRRADRRRAGISRLQDHEQLRAFRAGGHAPGYRQCDESPTSVNS
jgi:tripartite-type tricarboxylate transporter receptor subunit TctC